MSEQQKSENELTVDNLRTIREMLVDPIIDRFDTRFTQIGNSVESALKEMRAMMRTIQDPETGYVPRAMFRLIEDKSDLEHKRLQGEVDKINERLDKEEAKKPQRSSNLALWASVVVAVITAVAALLHH